MKSPLQKLGCVRVFHRFLILAKIAHSVSHAWHMKTLQLALPPKWGLSIVVLALAIWTMQHPSSATAQNSANAAISSSSQRWQMPVKAPVALVTSYLAPATPYAAGHRGIDLLVKSKEVVLAPSDGRVGFVGQVAKKPVVSIEHPGGFVSSFEPVCSTLLAGQKVHRGQALGFACGSIHYKSHCAPKLCLHYSIRSAGLYLSPLGVAGALPPSHTVSEIDA